MDVITENQINDKQQGPSKNRRPEVVMPQTLPLDFIEGSTQFRGGSRRRQGRRLMLWSWTAAFIDFLVLIFLSSMFVIFCQKVLKISFDQKLFLTSSILGLSWIYMIALRTFVGATVGEYGCDVRLGSLMERKKDFFPIRIMLRETLILLSGILTIPLLSMLLGRDILGQVTGLHLQSLK